ncbi:MAG: hypothetical protein MUP22_02750 [Desulfobacterales bacterium]|nr:hypothetical protein [Desulfobacterales bacterium]
MAPKKGLIVKDHFTSDIYLKHDTHVWVHNQNKETAEIEYKNKFCIIPSKIVIESPVPLPDKNVLLALDPCFLSDNSAFVEVYTSDKYYRILQCKKHNTKFLEDSRGGIALYSKLIYIEKPDDEPGIIWEHYHSMSDDWLNYLKIAK